jgi:glycosyltransferase involved in cell wall biosynthesis
MILFGHPTGAPFSHNAALAHFESKCLEAFCVPWMPTPEELVFLQRIPGLGDSVKRLERRYFPALAAAPRIEGRIGEWSRMVRRLAFGGRFATEALSYEANDWLMRTMRRESRRATVTAVHAYEDCSLWSFEEAKRLGKACIYDLPIGYYPAWERKQAELSARFADWLPPGGLPSNRFVRPEQKKREMDLADLVLVPCSFVRGTIERYADKSATLAPYGVDLDFWRPDASVQRDASIRFIYAGQCSLRKGLPVLLDAWKRAGLKDATLDLVGTWQFTEQKLRDLPSGVNVIGPVSAAELRMRYQCSDVFVFPSFFEGFGLVILEAMACGLPVIATDATAAPDVLANDCGRIVPAGNVDALVDELRWFAAHRDLVYGMRHVARATAERHSWSDYRACVSAAVAPFL